MVHLTYHSSYRASHWKLWRLWTSVPFLRPWDHLWYRWRVDCILLHTSNSMPHLWWNWIWGIHERRSVPWAETRPLSLQSETNTLWHTTLVSIWFGRFSLYQEAHFGNLCNQSLVIKWKFFYNWHCVSPVNIIVLNIVAATWHCVSPVNIVLNP